MAYKEGSMGLAILLGFIVYIGLSFVLSMFVSPVDVVVDPVTGFPVVDPVTGMPQTSISILYIILVVIMTPMLTGLLAGGIARGGAGRGFMAGFSAVVVGYYIMLLIMVLLTVAFVGTANIGMIFQGMAMGGMFGGALMVAILLSILVVPIILGVIGGIGGAIISALTATTVAAASGSQASTTNIIQAPAPVGAPVVVQGGTTNTSAPSNNSPAPAANKVLCPACKMENDSKSTFCQGCGTRLKS
jgi:hypothetical protein